MSHGIARLLGIAACAAVLGLTGWWCLATQAEEKKEDPAVTRTRKQVQMLDDLYKTAVVLITSHYVTEASDLPAGAAAIALFDAMKKKGWHDVRLIDASGEPLDKENVATDDFEKAAVAALKKGQMFHEQVVEKDGKRTFRAATPIPVVLKKCTLCHPNYEKAKPGEVIGILSYQLPVE